MLDRGQLTPEQCAAIDAPESIFLIACPGSGKTRTLTYKVASELAAIDSHRKFVAAITYTHRAADEIEERIADLGVDVGQLWIGTIHAFCLEWILKPYHVYHPKIARGFSVIDTHQREEMLSRLCRPYSYAKVSFYDCEFYYTDGGYELGCQDLNKHEILRTVLAEYLDELESARLVDFELILQYAFELIRDMPEICGILSHLIPFVAVDEYQDTKRVQYLILAAILRAGNGSTRTFIVGDPNQAIFSTLGGYAIPPEEFERMAGQSITVMHLSQNFRSTSRIIEYFGGFAVNQSPIDAASKRADEPGLITFNPEVQREDLEAELIRLVEHSIEDLGIEPHEICILAPWWTHLAGMTRRLVAALPQYEFNGPGMVPFGHDWDNFWYKLAKLALTDASPRMYVTRLRWANQVLVELRHAGVDVSRWDARSLLRESNSISIDSLDGLTYLRRYFGEFFGRLGEEFAIYPALLGPYDAFFDSSSSRIAKLVKDGATFVEDVDSFRRVFRPRSGITVSTIHGVKGAEFDTVIAYALLEGALPHFNDPDKPGTANKLLYVVGSRARRNLHLLSERGRIRYSDVEYPPTEVLLARRFSYDSWVASV